MTNSNNTDNDDNNNSSKENDREDPTSNNKKRDYDDNNNNKEPTKIEKEKIEKEDAKLEVSKVINNDNNNDDEDDHRMQKNPWSNVDSTSSSSLSNVNPLQRIKEAKDQLVHFQRVYSNLLKRLMIMGEELNTNFIQNNHHLSSSIEDDNTTGLNELLKLEELCGRVLDQMNTIVTKDLYTNEDDQYEWNERIFNFKSQFMHLYEENKRKQIFYDYQRQQLIAKSSSSVITTSSSTTNTNTNIPVVNGGEAPPLWAFQAEMGGGNNNTTTNTTANEAYLSSETASISNTSAAAINGNNGNINDNTNSAKQQYEERMRLEIQRQQRVGGVSDGGGGSNMGTTPSWASSQNLEQANQQRHDNYHDKPSSSSGVFGKIIKNPLKLW